MVYAEAARKTGALMVLAAVLSVAIITVTDAPTAMVTVDTKFYELSGANWVTLSVGILIGALMIGTYFYLAHIEAKRDF